MTETCIVEALSKKHDFVSNPQVRTNSEAVPRRSRDTDVESQEPNEDRSKNDPHLEVASSVYQFHHSLDIDPDEDPHRLTRVHKEITLCSPETSSRKKMRSTSQPKVRIENTLARFEAD